MSDLALMQELGLEEDPDELHDAAAAEKHLLQLKAVYYNFIKY